MRETEKRKPFYIEEDFFEKYLVGDGIDIGCGRAPIVDDDSCLKYDRVLNSNHDADTLIDLEDSRFDWVYSSHCLEHTKDPKKALSNWWRVLKQGGFMIVVVPDFMLYEQFQWPSRYNSDHKHRFSLGGLNIPNHYSLVSLVESLPGAQIVSAKVRDYGYDYQDTYYDRTLGDQLAEIEVVVHKKLHPFWWRSDRFNSLDN